MADGLAARTVRVRAPGRVNLIGEHTDYSHLPVLPIAIDRGLTIEISANDTGVVTARSDQFPGEVRLDRERQKVRVPGWGAYLAGAVAELDLLAPGAGATIHLSGDLPAGGGLSSSSALTVGVVAGLNAAWDGGLSREDIALRAAEAERHAGVETGGMDQAVIALAEPGCALRIDFEPTIFRPLALPEGLAFVAAFSRETSAKGGEARAAYNERVIGARFAAALLCETIGLDASSPPRLADVAALPESELLVEELPERANALHVARGTGILAASLVALSHGSLNERDAVPVRAYARHILAEARRVDAAESALLGGDLEAFGALLNASHESLRKDLACSTHELDALCAAMRDAGALGARLTGAGFGGYALAAVPHEAVDRVVAAAVEATGGPAFEVHASGGYTVE